MIETNALTHHRARAYAAELNLASSSWEWGSSSSLLNARRAYETVHGLLGNAEFDPPDLRRIEGKLQALRTRLEEAGERFPE